MKGGKIIAINFGNVMKSTIKLRENFRKDIYNFQFLLLTEDLKGFETPAHEHKKVFVNGLQISVHTRAHFYVGLKPAKRRMFFLAL